MRVLVVIAFVACGRSTPSADAPAVTYGQPIACMGGLSCGPTNTNDRCDLTVDAALHDASLCPAFYSTCADDWTFVGQQGVDTSVEYMYRQGPGFPLHGELVAIMHFSAEFGQYCSEGPPSFAPPMCQAMATKLPACP